MKNNNPVEEHPLGFFLPEQARLLILGSFPPPKTRWSMSFYYPNFQNDMWKIMGLLFYENPAYFVEQPKKYNETAIRAFCLERGIAFGDTALQVVRLTDNASDKHLEVIQPIALEEVLAKIPLCHTIAVTGQKAMDTLKSVLHIKEEPAIGQFVHFTLGAKTCKLYRMPSTSRAYPLALKKKADYYRLLFEELNLHS